jgi:hypothetical protein
MRFRYRLRRPRPEPLKHQLWGLLLAGAVTLIVAMAFGGFVLGLVDMCCHDIR